MRKKMTDIFVIVLAITVICFTNNRNVVWGKLPEKRTGKIVTINIRNTKKIKLKNASKKIRWKVNKKGIVKIVKRKGKNNIVIIKGINVGSTKLIAKCRNERYTFDINVKKSKKNKKSIDKQTVETTKYTVEQTTNENTTKVDRETTLETTKISSEVTTNNFVENKKYKITAKLKNNKIKNSDNLEITYIVEENDGENCKYDIMPYVLLQNTDQERQEAGDKSEISVWRIIKDYTNDFEIFRERKVINGSGTFDVSIPLEKYYGNLTPGLYQYVHIIEGKSVAVNFYIIS